MTSPSQQAPTARSHPPHRDTPIRNRLQAALTDAQGAKDAGQACVLRMALCAINDRDRDAQHHATRQCSSDEEAGIVARLIADRQNAALQHEENGRLDLAERERADAELLRACLPKKLTGEGLRAAAHDVLIQLDAHRLKDLGKCLTTLSQRFPGQVDPVEASQVMRGLLR